MGSLCQFNLPWNPVRSPSHWCHRSCMNSAFDGRTPSGTFGMGGSNRKGTSCCWNIPPQQSTAGSVNLKESPDHAKQKLLSIMSQSLKKTPPSSISPVIFSRKFLGGQEKLSSFWRVTITWLGKGISSAIQYWLWNTTSFKHRTLTTPFIYLEPRESQPHFRPIFD